METSEHIEQCFTDIRDYIEELKETIGSLGHLNRTISSTAQKGIRELESRLAQVERERDAALHDFLRDPCEVCKHGETALDDCNSLHTQCKFEWRGVCPENTKEEEK